MFILRNQKGYSVILVPIILSLIASFVALNFDFGRVFILKHQLQSVADSAAVAGASMIKVEFLVDSNGRFQFDNTQINMVDEKVYSEAELVYNKNMEILRLQEKGITILEKKGTIKDGKSFEYYIKATVPMGLGIKLLGLKDMQEITIVSEAEPADKM